MLLQLWELRLRLFKLIAVEIDHHRMAQGLDFARLGVFQALLHLEARVAYLGDSAFADNRVVEMHRHTEVQVHMDEDIFESQPVNFGLEDMLEVAASAHVEEIALRPVVDVIIRVEVAHSDLDGTGVHI